MTTTSDYSILDKFHFEYKPIGFKSFFVKPEGIKKLEKDLYMCEMIKEAQMGNTFYLKNITEKIQNYRKIIF